MKEHIDDTEIIKMIQKGGKQADQALIYLIDQHRSYILSYLKKKKYKNPEDIFQEGLVSTFLQIQDKVFKQESSIKTYLMSICNNLALSQLRKQVTRDKTLNETKSKYSRTTSSPEDIAISAEKTEIIESLLNELGENCKKVLSLWSLHYSMDEIAIMTDYKNANSVKKKKFLCMQKLMKLVKQNKHLIK